MRVFGKTLFIIFSIVTVVYSISSLYVLQGNNRSLNLSNLVDFPAPVIKTVSFEFSGIFSDYLMLHTLSFLGQKVIDNQDISQNDWNTVYKSLTLITELDPNFSDAYILAATILPWEANMVKETNTLLEKATKEIPSDYRPFFFLWYNYYFFLKDPQQAALYLQKASLLKGAPAYFKNLTARMYLFAGEHEAAILFLKECIKSTSNRELIEIYSIRLESIEKIYYLEKKVAKYIEAHSTPPTTLSELVLSGLIKEIPRDPYGGNFFITPEGRVYSTSKLAQPPSQDN